MNCVSPGPVETPILPDFLETLGERAEEDMRVMDRPGQRVCGGEKRPMNEIAAIVLLPLIVLAIGVYMAVNIGDPMWLVFGAVLAMATGYLARRIFGS